MARNNNLRCDSFWGGYGFSFKKTYDKKKRTFTKWFMVLNKLYFSPMTKNELWNSIDYNGYNKEGICKRSWNSYVLSALKQEGYIFYNKSEKVWEITPKGRTKFVECSWALQNN